MLQRTASALQLKRKKSTTSTSSTASQSPLAPPVPAIPRSYTPRDSTSSGRNAEPRQSESKRVSIPKHIADRKMVSSGSEDLYDKLAHTARAFIESTNAATPRANDPDYELIRSFAAPHFRIEWAPKLFAQFSPVLDEAKDIDGFLAHIKSMSANLSTWAILVQDLFVDVKRRSVVARADFWMMPTGSEKVLNDIVFFMKMDQSGEKIIDCTEYVDPEASKIIKGRMATNSWERSASGHPTQRPQQQPVQLPGNGSTEAIPFAKK